MNWFVILVTIQPGPHMSTLKYAMLQRSSPGVGKVLYKGLDHDALVVLALCKGRSTINNYVE